MNTTSHEAYAIHWFRRDLRVAGNPALRQAWKKTRGRVVGVFHFDSRFLERSDFSHNRFAFFLETLSALREELRAIGSDLLVLDSGPDEGFRAVFRALSAAGSGQPAFISWNRDYEPFARDRDARLERYFQNAGLATIVARDHLLIEPEEIARPDGGFYQVYSPFARRWFERLSSEAVQQRIQEQAEGLRYLEDFRKGKIAKDLFRLRWSELLGKEKIADALEEFKKKNSASVSIPIPPAGALAALSRAQAFAGKVGDYKEERDFPWKDGTSQLSMFFKNGSFTGAQCLALYKLGGEEFKQKTGPAHFVKELAWREFYYHILWHQPRVEKEAFLEKYRDLPWENNEKYWEAWKAGRTGYPIVDAGMRQLRETGWMHNRVRMIVASFLTKDLLIDWRWGERYFMEQLLDGDLAPNNGGWQWAASTGCDPQPYFRIFNPWLQGQKFDADGEYVRSFVPELAALKGGDAHETEKTAGIKGYVKPVVIHAEQKVKALAMFGSQSIRES